MPGSQLSLKYSVYEKFACYKMKKKITSASKVSETKTKQCSKIMATLDSTLSLVKS